MLRALKAAAAVAVVGVLMGGQCTTSGPGTLAFSWRFADKKGAIAGDYTAASSGCSTAVVDSVTVTLDGTDYASNPCAAAGGGLPGLDIVDVPAGDHSYIVSAYRGSELAFQGSGQVRSSGVKTSVPVTLAATGTASTLHVFYQQAGTYTCYGTPYVAYEIDFPNGAPIDVASFSNGTQLLCDITTYGFEANYSTPGGPFPYGSYRIHYLSLLDGFGSAKYQICCQLIDHEGFAQVFSLQPAGAACPINCP